MGATAPPSPETAHRRARVARLVQLYGAKHPESIAAKSELEFQKLIDHAVRVLSQAPPLTEEQRTQLAELLRPAREQIAAARRAKRRGSATT